MTTFDWSKPKNSFLPSRARAHLCPIGSNIQILEKSKLATLLFALFKTNANSITRYIKKESYLFLEKVATIYVLRKTRKVLSLTRNPWLLSFQRNPWNPKNFCTFIEHFRQPNEVMYQSADCSQWFLGFHSKSGNVSKPVRFKKKAIRNNKTKFDLNNVWKKCQFRFHIGSYQKKTEIWRMTGIFNLIIGYWNNKSRGT